MNDPAQLNWLVPLLALALGVLFGAVAQRFNFCTMGAVADVVNFGDWRRMRMWLLAIVVAIAGTTMLVAAGQIDLSKCGGTGGLWVPCQLRWNRPRDRAAPAVRPVKKWLR